MFGWGRSAEYGCHTLRSMTVFPPWQASDQCLAGVAVAVLEPPGRFSHVTPARQYGRSGLVSR